MKATFTLASKGCPMGEEITEEKARELAGETIGAVLGNGGNDVTIDLDDGNWIIVSYQE